MRLAYLCLDELNRALVRGWAGRRGIRVECPNARLAATKDRFDAVLLDLDHMPPDWQAEALAAPAAGGRPIVAHGYSESGDLFRGRGVAVHPRLRSAVLRELACAALGARRAAAQADEVTWVNVE